MEMLSVQLPQLERAQLVRALWEEEAAAQFQASALSGELERTRQLIDVLAT